jgi:PAS domain S-box-containing protein
LTRVADPEAGDAMSAAQPDSVTDRWPGSFEQHLAGIVENSDDAIVSKDLDGRILYWNDAATRMYGYTAEEAMGQPIEIVIPEDPKRREEELNIRDRIGRGERFEHYETIRRHKDGTELEVSLSISPVRDASGRVVAAAGFARDISNRRVIESAQYLAAIVENSDDAIVSIDLDGAILSWNDAATRMYGYADHEAIGQRIEIVIPEDPKRRQEELEIRARIARGERIEHYETERRRKDSTRFPVSLSISPVPDAFGRIVAAASSARDISQRRLLESAQYLAAIVDNSDDAIVSKDLDGTILSWNDAATRMYGYTTDEAMGQPIEIVIPEDPKRRQEELEIRARIARGERIEHYETERRRKDSTRFPVSLSISPVPDAFGRIVAAAGFARDVTEQRRAIQSTEYLAAIVQNSDDAIVSKDLDGTILSWNDAATRMYGYTTDEAMGHSIEIVIPEDPKRREEELEIRARIARGERIEHYETERRRKDGTRFPVSVSISPVREASGRIVAAAGFARDISERRVLESAKYLAAIVENSDDAIVSIDPDGKILSWNDAATRMYGYTTEEAMNRRIDIVIPDDPKRRQEELDIRDRIARGEQIKHHETTRRRKHGDVFQVSLSISPVRDASGLIVAAAGFARDISERKRLEAERRRANGFLTSFANFSAHDFKTPMQHILWDSQAALDSLDASDDVEVRKKLERIIATSRWMQSRTDGLLLASGLSQGKHPPRERVSSQQAFDEALRTLAEVDQLVQHASVTSEPLPDVVSNEVLLGFLFRNLLENACKYGQVGVPVAVHACAERTDGAWQFSIRDNGRGISPDKLESIFDAGVRGENVNADEPGSGIGLHFCRTIIAWHQGKIWAESQPESGSTFKFTIPDPRTRNG